MPLAIIASTNIRTFKVLPKLPSEISKNRFVHILTIPKLIYCGWGTHESFGEGHDEDNKTLNDVFVTYTELKTRTSGSFFHKKSSFYLSTILNQW